MARLLDLEDTPEPEKAPVPDDTPASERWKALSPEDKHRIRQAAKMLRATDIADKVRLSAGITQEHLDAAVEEIVTEEAAKSPVQQVAPSTREVRIVDGKPKSFGPWTKAPSGMGALVKRILSGEKNLAPRPPRRHVVQRRPGYPTTVKTGTAILGYVLKVPKGYRPHMTGTGPFAPYPTEQEAIDFILEHAPYPAPK